MEKYVVYVLKSLAKERYYIGCSRNLEKRIKYHNSGKNKSTKPYKPWEIIYFEEYNDKKQAFQREWFFKHPNGYKDKLDIIKKFGEVA